MKKRIIALLLIAALCLGLCACGKKVPQEQLDMLCGMWYAPETAAVVEDGMPGYLEFTADGKCSYNGEGEYTWSAKPHKKMDDVVIVTIKTDSKEKHTFDLWVGDPNFLEGGLTLSEEGPNTYYRKVNTVCETSWVNEAMIEWFSSGEEDNVAESVVVNADGTCTIDGATYFWTTDNYSDQPEEYMHFEVFSVNGREYTLDFSKRSNGLVEMSMNVTSGYDYNWGGNYICHPMLNTLSNYGSWESFDRNTCIDDYIWISGWSETSEIGDTEYDLAIDISAADSLTVNYQEGGNTRYSAKLFMDGEYPMVILTDVESGQETLYYNGECGYVEGHPDAAYYKVINQVYDYANGWSIYDEETDEHIYREDALPYLYEKLQALGDYKQTQEFLDRFTIVPSVLTEVVRYTKDQLNNISDSTMSQYQYDQNGVLIAASGEDIIEQYGIDEDWYWQYFTYDESGKIIEIQAKSGDSVYAVGTPTYDAAGNMVRMTVHTTSGAYDTNFIYDDQGRRIMMAMPEDYCTEPRTIVYTYDDQGRLLTKVDTWNDGYYCDTSTYAYSSNALSSVTTVHTRRGTEEYVRTHVYTNDAQGRPLTIAVTTTEDVTYRSRELQYNYEDLYFFDNTGLVFEEE